MSALRISTESNTQPLSQLDFEFGDLPGSNVTTFRVDGTRTGHLNTESKHENYNPVTADNSQNNPRNWIPSYSHPIETGYEMKRMEIKYNKSGNGVCVDLQSVISKHDNTTTLPFNDKVFIERFESPDGNIKIFIRIFPTFTNYSDLCMFLDCDTESRGLRNTIHSLYIELLSNSPKFQDLLAGKSICDVYLMIDNTRSISIDRNHRLLRGLTKSKEYSRDQQVRFTKGPLKRYRLFNTKITQVSFQEI